MALAINATFTGDCRSVVVSMTGQTPGTAYRVNLKHVSTGNTDSGVIDSNADSYGFTGLSLGGVYKVETINSSTQAVASIYIVSACAVNKCLVLLTDKLLSCGCTDPACASLLDKAQKIMLLIKTAESTAARITRPEEELFVNDAEAQYKKAVQMCEGNCDCGC